MGWQFPCHTNYSFKFTIPTIRSRFQFSFRKTESIWSGFTIVFITEPLTFLYRGFIGKNSTWTGKYWKRINANHMSQLKSVHDASQNDKENLPRSDYKVWFARAKQLQVQKRSKIWSKESIPQQNPSISINTCNKRKREHKSMTKDNTNILLSGSCVCFTLFAHS